ncbi:MAG TPA: radical SAM protein [Dissulfurispiraceae bacterium]|nr:radical SAM protein [Dissulfurispiraceae bacterium]
MNRRLIEKADALLAKEKGAIVKDPGGRISFCLVYPNTYRVGMSNLGFQGLYGLLNRREDVVCERAFLPDQADIEAYLRTGTPVFSLETKRPLNAFSIVAFSLSFENDYPNVFKILALSKIPFRTADRTEFDPLVMAGGVAVSFNPEPLALAFDLIFIGEAEESLMEFIDIYERAESRESAGKKAKQLTGVYVPSAYETGYDESGRISWRTCKTGYPDVIRKRTVEDISLTPLSTAIITSETEFSDMYLVELMRGCPWRCRFCLVGNFFGPMRKKDVQQISAEIAEGKRVAEKIGLIGPSLSDYPHISDILCIDGVRFSITSLRASNRSAELIGFLKGLKSVAIAPEAGTERLRRVIHKQVTESDILSTAGLLFESGIETLRLYFMIGLPTETDEDISGIVDLASKIRALSKTAGIVLSVSTFVPKPFTPFQWHAMDGLNSVKGKIRMLKKSLESKGVKIFHDVPKYAYMQGLFSLGDRRILPVIERMSQTDDFRKSCSDVGIDPSSYIFRQKDVFEVLPWDFIDIGVPRERLWDEYVKAVGLAHA